MCCDEMRHSDTIQPENNVALRKLVEQLWNNCGTIWLLAHRQGTASKIENGRQEFIAPFQIQAAESGAIRRSPPISQHKKRHCKKVGINMAQAPKFALSGSDVQRLSEKYGQGAEKRPSAQGA